jgi:hypothetical protein
VQGEHANALQLSRHQQPAIQRDSRHAAKGTAQGRLRQDGTRAKPHDKLPSRSTNRTNFPP